jgi:hypothetical protein
MPIIYVLMVDALAKPCSKTIVSRIVGYLASSRYRRYSVLVERGITEGVRPTSAEETARYAAGTRQFILYWYKSTNHGIGEGRERLY